MDDDKQSWRRYVPVTKRLLALCILFGVSLALLTVISAPSPYLLAGVIAGATLVLSRPTSRPFPEPARHFSLAVVGLGAGAMIQPDVVSEVLSRPGIILGASVGTLAVTLLAGQVLRLSPAISPSTAALASIAGGASGVTAIARELDADEAVVAAIQYFRVIVVIATVSFVAPLMGGTPGDASDRAGATSWAGIVVAALCGAIGLAIAHKLTFGGSRLLIPMLLAAVASATNWFPSPVVPELVLNLGYAIIGLTVGCSFTSTTLRLLRRVAWLAVVQLILSVGACMAVGLLVTRFTGGTVLDGYLATTPAGLPAVIAIAVGSNTDIGLIITVQVLRLFAALALASAFGAIIRRRRS
ncbi:AbrB family transcriptional regulator [Corynebacterium glyciniphilum]|uniref:AbrB family transcriptional regulator n=1 Tax=Corynebacterium glyciniphilum TaxID=1404244 RepID=UPI003DA15F6B